MYESISPLFSIIIVSLNAGKLIKKTVNSVLNQKFLDYEIIIKDGLSRDNTIEQIPLDNRIHIYNESDSSIYDAMNQAILYSKGKFIIFLNCGDLLQNDQILFNIAEEVNANKLSECIIYGNYRRNGINILQPNQLSLFYLFRTPLCHQSIFFASELFKKYGNYNTDYKIIADYNYILNLWFHKVSFKYFDLTICDYLGGGVSETKKGIEVKTEEYKKVKKKYFSLKQRIIYGIILFLTFRKLRIYLSSDKAPVFIRKLYLKLVNKINRI